jgi:RimJ/RimL family protein N-acetyltransferase
LNTFPLDRAHPPRRLVFEDAARHLVLRPWAFDDIDGFLAAIEASRAELRAFMPWAHESATRDDAYTLISRFQAEYWAGEQYVLGMFDDRDQVLGSVGLHPRVPLNPRALEVGYWVKTAESGRGWATLAVRVMVVLAFDWFDCDRLQVAHDQANVGSQRVVEKCGFTFEGVLRNHTAEGSESMRRDGYRATGRHRLYAMTPDDLARPNDGLAWLGALRRGITLFDALGHPIRTA